MLINGLTKFAMKVATGQSLRSPLVRNIAKAAAKREIFEVETMEDFNKEVIKSDKPVIVDFFANWCVPCKKLTPCVESIVREKAGKVKLAKVDIDELCELALDYDVASVPVLMVVKNGKVVKRMVGLQDREILRKWVNQAMSESE
ncbi:thioredoxin-like [Teleopsis dalmanni]|uniref:thioredoxin-like n=1 Tax=Teleopsis dalmanni TaxID=139649 RepID=UPI0018CFEADD|nr:thioredoxin-like [Teleopsis dalmanni]